MPKLSELQRGIDFMGRVVATFVLLEAAVLPLRQAITQWFSRVIHAVIPGEYSISWECTALDEVFLLSSAVLWSPGSVKTKTTGILTGLAVIWGYNVMRIAVLAYFPSPLLHEILFRIGGFAVVLLTYYGYMRWAMWNNGYKSRGSN